MESARTRPKETAVRRVAKLANIFAQCFPHVIEAGDIANRGNIDIVRIAL